MELNNKEIAHRIAALREDLGLSMQEMAEATGRTVIEYAAQESGEHDLSFTFLHKCAKALQVDLVELLTGTAPVLNEYQLVKSGEGLSIMRSSGFEYLHKAASLKNKLAEPFVVTAPYIEEEQNKPIHLSYHKGQEIDFILSGTLKFAYEDKIEIMKPGDFIMYDSGKGHGMIAIDGAPCTFLAVVIDPPNTRFI
ncbi:MAG: cupin domain-containing protein [Eggerthellaceae bacterium]|nr:cupin domain-containing protein [Eggerthellaceae bacterium]